MTVVQYSDKLCLILERREDGNFFLHYDLFFVLWLSWRRVQIELNSGFAVVCTLPPIVGDIYDGSSTFRQIIMFNSGKTGRW